jgi:excisionase family DNA binding protein
VTAPIIAALLAELDDDALDRLAALLAPRIEARIGARPKGPWLDARECAAHIKAPISRVYALSSSGGIPAHRDGSRLLFKRDELDAWIESGGGRRS